MTGKKTVFFSRVGVVYRIECDPDRIDAIILEDGTAYTVPDRWAHADEPNGRLLLQGERWRLAQGREGTTCMQWVQEQKKLGGTRAVIVRKMDM